MALSRLLSVLVVLLCIFCYVDAHAWMSNPLPRGQVANPKKRIDLEYQPTANNDPFDNDIICRSDPVMPRASWQMLTAGQTLKVSFTFVARHPGDCFFYITYDGDKDQSQMKWFKIWEQHDCSSQNDFFTITIPSYLPSAAHAIVRWEWYALHLMDMGHGHVEYFSECVDATILGFTGGQLPQPQVNIPGHLPRLNATNYWDPYNGGPEFFTGPPVATLNGAPMPPTTPTTPASTPKPTARPTVTPPPTAKPTSRPTVPTPAPSTPSPTKPTARPTPSPTTKPSATSKHSGSGHSSWSSSTTRSSTSAPTIRPTSTPTPTTRPVPPSPTPPRSPTTRPSTSASPTAPSDSATSTGSNGSPCIPPKKSRTTNDTRKVE